jgi:hypothetical protein
MSKNIDTVSHLEQVYEAFDTIAEDRAELGVTTLELLAECGDDRELKHIVLDEAAKDKDLIRQREDYVLKSLFKTASLAGSDMQLAALEYTSGYDDPEELEKASKRVSHYNEIIEKNIANGAPLHVSLTPPERTAPITVTDRVRLHGRTDPTTGKTWYNITNPRTVEYIDRAGDPKPVMSYEVVEKTEDDGKITVIARQPSSGEATIKAVFSKDSKTWKLSDDGKHLGLVIPGNSKSLLESGLLEQLSTLIESNDEVTQAAVNAAGANVPNIIESFEHPDKVNPVPLSNPKRN